MGGAGTMESTRPNSTVRSIAAAVFFSMGLLQIAPTATPVSAVTHSATAPSKTCSMLVGADVTKGGTSSDTPIRGRQPK